MDKIEKFTLINKDRSRIKVFEPFEEAIEFQEERINALEGRRIIDVEAN